MKTVFEISIITFVLLFVKHFVIDFVLQTRTMVEEKGSLNKPGGYAHAISHMLGTFFMVLIASGLVASLAYGDNALGSAMLDHVLALVLVDGVTHYAIDYTKMNIGKKMNLTPNKTSFWIAIGLDQLAHYLVYAWIVWYLFSDLIQ